MSREGVPYILRQWDQIFTHLLEKGDLFIVRLIKEVVSTSFPYDVNEKEGKNIGHGVQGLETTGHRKDKRTGKKWLEVIRNFSDGVLKYSADSPTLSSGFALKLT